MFARADLAADERAEGSSQRRVREFECCGVAGEPTGEGLVYAADGSGRERERDEGFVAEGVDELGGVVDGCDVAEARGSGGGGEQGVVHDVDAAAGCEGSEGLGGAIEGPETNHEGGVKGAGFEGEGLVEVGELEGAEVGEGGFAAGEVCGVNEGREGVGGCDGAAELAGELKGCRAFAAGELEDAAGGAEAEGPSEAQDACRGTSQVWNAAEEIGQVGKKIGRGIDRLEDGGGGAAGWCGRGRGWQRRCGHRRDCLP